MTSDIRLSKPLSLTEWAYNIIKDDILNNRYPPGSLLQINELSTKLKISRTPVREAFLLLQNEGLLRSEQRVGFFVTEITRRDIEERLDLRSLLEGYAVETAAPFFTEEDLKQLEDNLEACEKAVKQGHKDEFMEFDSFFHSLILERAPNSNLKVMVRLLDSLTYRTYQLDFLNEVNVQASLDEHRDILNALRQRDGEQAKTMMQIHLDAAKKRHLEIFDASLEQLK